MDFRHKFVTLQIGMKNVVMKYVSVFMALWYCLSIIGFDVHSCTRTGEKFIASAFIGTTCEDIHPEHSCHEHGSCCCHHGHGSHEGESLEDQDCCTNDIHVLSVPGVTSDDAQRHYGEWNSNHCPCDLHLMSECRMPSSDGNAFSYYPTSPDSGLAVPAGQALLMVWRI